MTLLTRRAFLALAALLTPLASLRPKGHTAQPAVSLDEFVRLSQRLTGKAALDRDVAALYLKALQGDPNLASRLALAVRTPPVPADAALENTIIEWWYTGIYSVNGESKLGTYAGALMWAAMGLSAAGTCAGPFGSWSRPSRTRA
jgi:hypothetical protein